MTEVVGLVGNPSSPHEEGRRAKDVLEAARNRVAAALACRPREIVFTGSGTEASQLGLLGVARARHDVSPRVVVGAVEHPAILDAADLLGREGFELVVVPPTPDGRIEPDRLLEAIAPGAAVVALMLANHETGAIMPVAEVAGMLAARDVPLVCDACLGPGRLPVRVTDLGADVVAFSAHKFNGPKGIGMLRVARGVRVRPLWSGGLQEERLRPGTENVAGAVGLACALEDAIEDTSRRARRYATLLRCFLDRLVGLDDWTRVGPEEACLPGVATLEVGGIEGEAAMINLDLEGVAVATGSTCALGASEPSATLRAMGFDRRRAARTLRISIGEGLDGPRVEEAAACVADVVRRLRSLGRA
jgi:cysteine desulfurase